MRRVGEKALHPSHEAAPGNGGRLLEFLLPGPVTLTRFLLAVPVWPMLLVYSEGASFWPFSMARRGDHSLPWSDEALWANPWDWFRVSGVGREGGGRKQGIYGTSGGSLFGVRTSRCVVCCHLYSMTNDVLFCVVGLVSRFGASTPDHV